MLGETEFTLDIRPTFVDEPLVENPEYDSSDPMQA